MKKPTSKKVITDDMLHHYLNMDDHDVFISIKSWLNCGDQILADLSARFLNRSLFRTTFRAKKQMSTLKTSVQEQTRKLLKKKGFPHDEKSASFYYDVDESYSEAYKYENESIWILGEGEKAIEFSKAADTKHIIALTKPVVKPYLVHLKELRLPSV